MSSEVDQWLDIEEDEAWNRRADMTETIKETEARRYAELDEEFHEDWHPSHGGPPSGMYVHKIVALEAKLAKAERDLDEERNRYADMTVEELLIEAIQSTDYSEVKYVFDHSEKIAALAEESET